jgi:Mn2+/Fe2+ NRAMP family transporter
VEKKMGQTGRTEVIHLDDNLIHYRTSLWERITAIVCAVTVILFVFIVVLREQPFSDPNQVILIRMILSLAIAILGAVVPGFLNVSLSGKSGKK